MRKLILICIGVILSCASLRAQDPSFTQAFYNPVYLNPAFAGSNEGMRFCLNHRDQWDRIPGVFTTSSFSFDVREPCLNSAWGVNAVRDVEGEGLLTTSSLGLTYAYGNKLRFLRNESYFSFGLSAKVASTGIDWSKLEFYDQLDPIYGKLPMPSGAQVPQNVNSLYPDFNGGFLLEGKKFCKKPRDYALWNAGFAVYHLLQPDISIYSSDQRLPMRFTIHSGVMLPFTGNSRLKGGYVFPHIVLQKQGNLYELLAGTYALRDPFILGLSYHVGQNPANIRNTNAFCVVAGYQKPFKNTNYSWQFTYSYDLNFTGLSLSTYGSHELGFIIFFDGKSVLCSGSNSTTDARESPCLKVRRKGLMPPF